MLRRSLQHSGRKVDVCVLGGGPGGVAAALRAREYGKTACIVEQARVGGADLWRGALQSKTMWEMAKFAKFSEGNMARRFLVPTRPLPDVRHAEIQRAIEHAATTRERQIREQLVQAGVPVVHGMASFVTPNAVRVTPSTDAAAAACAQVGTSGGAQDDVIEADYFIIATGGQPRPHPTVHADGDVVLTSDTVMYNPLPRSIVVIGAGIIGCEFCTIFANFGQTQVSVIEKSGRILPMEDDDVALYVQMLLEKKNVRFHHNSTLVDSAVVACGASDNAAAASAHGGRRFRYTLRNTVDGRLDSFVVDKALVSIGRIPNVAALGLDTIGVTLHDGRLVRDRFMRVPPHKHIYACGDVATRVLLVNVAEHEGRRCVEHIYTPLPEEQLLVSLDNLSTIMFLDQEVAAVGMNEQQCRAARVAYKVAKYSYDFVARALARGNTRGFVKLLVTNDTNMQVLGVRAVGSHASSIIELASMAIHNKESAYNLRNLYTAYPGMTEAFQECLHVLLGTSTHKPNVFPQITLREWTPPHFDRGRAYAGE